MLAPGRWHLSWWSTRPTRVPAGNDNYFHTDCISVRPKTSKSYDNHCRPGLWGGRVDHWWLLPCDHYFHKMLSVRKSQNVKINRKPLPAGDCGLAEWIINDSCTMIICLFHALPLGHLPLLKRSLWKEISPPKATNLSLLERRPGYSPSLCQPGKPIRNIWYQL